jgi:hypothetical protein
MSKIIIRPSSVDAFLQCPQQWYQVFIKGRTSIPGARAAIGTAIHKAAEVLWNNAMKTRSKDSNMSELTDAAMEAYSEEEQKGLMYDKDENKNTAAVEIVKGTEAFVEDVVPWVSIPTGVEKRFTVELEGHPIVSAVSGTVDYIADGIIADLKTTKRKPTVANYKTQQSIYKFLAEKNGVNVKENQIHGVVLKKVPEGTVIPAAIDVPQAKSTVNTLLDTLEVYNEDIVDPDILFRGNPKYYLCSPKYCSFYNECKFVKGES